MRQGGTKQDRPVFMSTVAEAARWGAASSSAHQNPSARKDLKFLILGQRDDSAEDQG